MSEQLTLQLPYEEITKTAGRKQLRDLFDKKLEEYYFIPFNQITVREGFNRTVFEGIEELAGLIAEHGQKERFVVDVLLDGTVKLEQGERRYKARQLMIQQGLMKETDLVECKVNPKETTEQERAENIWVTNMGRQNLHSLDQAIFMHRQKHLFTEKPVPNTTLAKKFNISRQTVDNLIMIAEMNDGLKHDIRHGTITVSAALDLVKDLKKLEKQADKEEDKSHITSASAPSLPQDPLKKELDELKVTEEQAEEFKQLEAQREQDYIEKLAKDAVWVDVTAEALEPHIGKRLAQNAIRSWSEDFVDPDNGEVVSIEQHEIVMKQGIMLTADVIEDLVSSGAEKVWVFKEVIASTSVITEPVATEEKSAFDESRPEIKAVQMAIKAADKIEAIVSKIEGADQMKEDISYQVYWLQRNLSEAREWIHKNKKQNKAR